METASDILVATMFGFSMKAKNVGAMTSIDESEGKSLISSEGKDTDERIFDDDKQYYFHEHRPTAKTGSEWNLKDELKREYLTSGNQTVTFTPSGRKTNAQKLDTEGEYVWRQETVDRSVCRCTSPPLGDFRLPFEWICDADLVAQRFDVGDLR
ncbi:MAG: hypothetical protein ABL888_01615 [Pirellulaceae bacterium]